MTLKYAYLYVILSLLFAISASAEDKTILNISAYQKGYKWTDDCVIGIKSKLEKKYNLITIYMNTKTLSKDQHRRAADKVWNTYIEIKPDLVMLGDDNALSYIGPKLANQNVPVVFYGINSNPRKYFNDGIVPKHITGILERAPIYTIVRIIKPLLKNAKNILMLFDNSPTSKGIIETILDDKDNTSISNFYFYSKVINTFKEWSNEIEQAPKKYDVIYLATFFTLKDDHGHVMNHLDVLKWTSEHTKIPVFGSSELMVADNGAMGAFVIEGEKHGQLAAEMASDILETGKMPSYKMHKETKLIFNKKQLKRFNITLPDNIKKISILN